MEGCSDGGGDNWQRLAVGGKNVAVGKNIEVQVRHQKVERKKKNKEQIKKRRKDKRQRLLTKRNSKNAVLAVGYGGKNRRKKEKLD